MADATNPAIWVALTPREIDLEVRLHYRVWEDNGFRSDDDALAWLLAVCAVAGPYLPEYVVRGLDARADLKRVRVEDGWTFAV